MKISVKKIIKRTAFTLLTIVLLLVALVYSLRIPAVQNFIKDQFIVYLEDKIKTDVELEYIYVDFPSTIELKQLYLKGEDVDTLLAVEKLNVGLDFWKILNRKVEINAIDLKGTTANITLKKDGTFNFDYILNAFASKEEDTSDSKPFLINLDKIKLEKIAVQYNDLQAGNHIKVKLNAFDTRIKTFDLEKNKYALGKINLDGLQLKLKQDFVEYVEAKTKEAKASTPTSPLQLKLDEINLANFDISYIDDVQQLSADLKFKTLNTFVQLIDLQKNNYGLDEITADGLRLKVKQGKSTVNKTSEASTENSSTPLQFALNQIKLSDTQLNYTDDNSKTFAEVQVNELNTKINKLDLVNNYYDLEEILLEKAKIKANLALSTSSSKTTETSTGKPLTVTLKQGKLEDLSVVYNNTNAKPIAKGLDYNHLNFAPINVDLRDFKMYEDQYSGSIKNASLKEKSGLNIQKFTTEFLYANNQAYLKELYLKTPQTILQKEIRLNYSSIDQLSSQLGKVRLYADIKNSRIGFKDLLLLAPDLKNTTPFDVYPDAILYANAKLNGQIDDLNIHQFTLSGIDDLNIKANGRIKHATNPAQLTYDLNVSNFDLSAKTIYAFLPKNTLPNNVRIPSKINLKGTAKGTTTVVDTNLKLTTTLGNALVKAKVDLSTKNAEKYNINAEVKNLQAGTLIGNDELGKITANLKVDGIGFDPKTAKINAEGSLIDAFYNEKQIKDIQLLAKVNQGEFDATVHSSAQYANLNLTVGGLYREDTLQDVSINGTIEELDLYHLNLYSSPLILAGGIQGYFKNLDPDQLNGNLQFTNLAFSDAQEIYPLDNLSLVCSTSDEENNISFKSQFIDLDIFGKYKLTQIFGAITNTINHYYQFQPQEDKLKIAPNQYISFEATIKNDPLLRKLIPELTDFEPVTLNAAYHADSETIEAIGTIPAVVYSDFTIENAKFNFANTNNQVDFNFDVNTLKNESFQLNFLNLNGDIKDNTINFEAKKSDESSAIQFLLAGNIKNENDENYIRLNPNGLILNYETWAINPTNYIKLGKNQLFANQFIMSYKDSQITLQSEELQSREQLNVSIANFKIETITEIVKVDELSASGVIDGTIQINDLSKKMTFGTDLTVSELVVYEHKIGNILAKVENTSPSVLGIDIELAGVRNNAKITGEYNTDKSLFDLVFNLNHLDMGTIESFSQKMINETDGYLSGNLTLTGSTAQPSILGKIKFNDVGFTVIETGSNFRKIDDSILFTPKGIEFDYFKINDKDNNSLTVNGDILTKNYRDFLFDLTVFGRDFKIVNAEKSSDALTYGILAVTANLQVKGDLDLPKVNGNLTVTDKTDFTFVLPQSSPELQEREGIVEFIDQDQVQLQETIIAQGIEAQSKIKGLDVSVNIEVNKNAKTTIVIDKANGDFLELQGEAQLTGGIDPSGKMTLVGVYEVQSGAYELSVSLVKRRFEIKQGSTITWTGEPTAAILNITAIYTVNAAPIDLVQQQLTGLSANETNMYKQKIPFNTNLILTGELLKPIINFNITLNDSNPSVSSTVIDNTKSKLDQLRTDESELNKQVFALIILGRFIGTDPFQSQAGVSAETLAKQSVSNILAQQLNNVAAELIKGVDINFGLNTDDDYSTGSKNTRTDLNVNVSKKLLNDRLKIMVGSNFGLEGQARENENMTNIAGDITIDYNISRNGRYVLRAYRKNEYQIALHGQVIETGIGFVITVDYDQFKEIFQKQRRPKTNQEPQRIESK